MQPASDVILNQNSDSPTSGIAFSRMNAALWRRFRGGLGMTAVVKENARLTKEYAIKQYIRVLRARKDTDPAFLRYVIEHPQKLEVTFGYFPVKKTVFAVEYEDKEKKGKRLRVLFHNCSCSYFRSYFYKKTRCSDERLRDDEVIFCLPGTLQNLHSKPHRGVNRQKERSSLILVPTYEIRLSYPTPEGEKTVIYNENYCGRVVCKGGSPEAEAFHGGDDGEAAGLPILGVVFSLLAILVILVLMIWL